MTTKFETADAAPKAAGRAGNAFIRLAVDHGADPDWRGDVSPIAARASATFAVEDPLRALFAQRGTARQLAPKARRLLCGFAIALADFAGFAASIAAVAYFGHAPDMTLMLALIGSAVMSMNWLSDLYPSDRLHAQESLRRRTLTTALACALIASFGGIGFSAWSTIALAEVYVLLAVILQAPLRMVARRLLYRAGLWGTPTDFFCDRNLAKVVEPYFTKNWHLGLIPAQGHGEIAATSYMPPPQEVEQLRLRYKDVIVLADLPDLRVSGLKPVHIGGVIGLSMGRPTGKKISTLKRAIDLAIAVPALIGAAPLVLLASAAIWMVDPGPVHYVQEREGFRGRTLRVLKLRTMYRDAESRLQELLRTNPAARAEWQSHFKLRDDPRVLPVIGKFLRVSSIDELPQLINVIKGDMSIVGPRPFPEYHLAAMPKEFRAKRCSVVPGITGLWQISARSDADIAQQQQLDEHYIDNQSIWLDLQIVLGTFAALVGGKGAY